MQIQVITYTNCYTQCSYYRRLLRVIPMEFPDIPWYLISKFVDQVLQCECCSRWYYCSCQNIDDKMLAGLVEFNSLHWYCENCEPSVPDWLKVAATQQDQQCDIEQHLQATECKLTDLTNSINNISSDSCSRTVSAQTYAIPENIRNPNLLPLRAVDEYRKREQCKLNLIFHKVPESTQSDPSSRWQYDIRFILTCQ